MIERNEFQNLSHAEASTRINYTPDYCGIRDWVEGAWKICTNEPMRGELSCVHHLIEAEIEEMEYLAQKEDQTEADCIKFELCRRELERLRRLA